MRYTTGFSPLPWIIIVKLPLQGTLSGRFAKLENNNIVHLAKNKFLEMRLGQSLVRIFNKYIFRGGNHGPNKLKLSN